MKRLMLTALLVVSTACGGEADEPLPEPEPEPASAVDQEVEEPPMEKWPGFCTRESTADGEPSSREQFWYDDQQRRLRREVHYPAEEGGPLEPNSLQKWTYDDGEQTGEQLFWHLPDEEPRPQARSEYIFDERGNILRAEHRRGVAFNLEDVQVFEYDDEDRVVREEWYDGAETSPSIIWTWSYDAEGRLLLRRSEVPATGSWSEEEHRYDDAGNEIYQRTEDEDGITVRRHTWESDSLEVTRVDEGDDGSVEHTYRTEYDERGNWIVSEGDEDGDGVYEIRNLRTNEYDTEGQLVLVELDRDADGEPETRTEYGYHPNGEMASQSIQPDDEDFPRVTKWDAAGNQTFESGQAIEGTAKIEVHYDYECWWNPSELPVDDFEQPDEPAPTTCEEPAGVWENACSYALVSRDNPERYPQISVTWSEDRTALSDEVEIREYDPDASYANGATVYRLDEFFLYEIVVNEERTASLFHGEGWFRIRTTPGEVVTLLLPRPFADMSPTVEVFPEGEESFVPTTLSLVQTEDCHRFDDRVDFVATSEVTDVYLHSEHEVQAGETIPQSLPLLLFVAEGVACQ